MIRWQCLLAGLTGLWVHTAGGADVPRGNLLELHSCEVYAGGCVVSSEAPQSGGYMFRAWNFNGGRFDGVDLAGLQIGVLQLSPDNLAAPDTATGKAVIYLPQQAAPAQRDALRKWLASSQADFHPSKTWTRIVPLQFTETSTGCTFAAGDLIRIRTAPFKRCELFTCGETLWYQPRSVTSLFTVVVDRASEVSEPFLQLKWDDSGKRNVFLARFGEPDSARNLYVTRDELCGSAPSLF
jgi:hypothetical protein